MSVKLYVGNLPDNCSKDSLHDLFGPYGTITELDVIKNFAFVHYNNEESAKNAIHDLDKTKILGQQITVQISKQKSGNKNQPNQRRDNRDSRDGRRDDRRFQPRNRGSMNGMGKGPIANPMGGILGAAPTPLANNPGGIGNLGIFSAVNTLAAVEQEQQRRNEQQFLERERRPITPDHDRYREREVIPERNQPDPDVRVRREVVHTDTVPNARQMGLSNGYVIYERYYVDPSHPLLKGLPIPELPRMTDTYVTREVSAPRPAPYTRSDDRGYKERSPLTERDDLLRERERDCRSIPYKSNEYYDRR